MTYTSIHFNPKKKTITIGIASYLKDVGKKCVYLNSNSGCVVAQGLVTNSIGPEAIALLSSGMPPNQVLDTVLASDTLKNQRQIIIIDKYGHSVIYSGQECNGYYGSLEAENLLVAGNFLKTRYVLKEMISSFKVSRQKNTLYSSLSALDAAELAGGDKRGKKAAALYHLKLGASQITRSDPVEFYNISDNNNPLFLLRKELIASENKLKETA